MIIGYSMLFLCTPRRIRSLEAAKVYEIVLADLVDYISVQLV